MEYYYPHHLDLPPTMKEIPAAPPLPSAPPAQDFSKLGVFYITVLGLSNQRPLATAVNYLVCIAPIVYMAFQARLSPLWESSQTLVWAVTSWLQTNKGLEGDNNIYAARLSNKIKGWLSEG
ncbi:hypothetical protein DSO57_1000016 [Entomophthora muscae]|uniref:Uncharacterized protein n=1 Tax=Entomophthora muscae TaxID=34485 RepID=A0ACC2SM39_9FUNG|nr:hypothetical protein DSO57_1000016 [Entomophthora muscae]